MNTGTGIATVYNENQRKRSNKTAQPIEPITLGTSATDVYVSSALNDFAIVHLWVANITALPRTYTLYFVPSGASAGAANTAIFEKSIAANTSEVVAVAVGHRIPAGAKIQALASAVDAVNIGGWGFDQGSEE